MWAGLCAFFATAVVIGMCVRLALPPTVPVPAAIGVGAAAGGLGAWLSAAAGVAAYRRLRAETEPDAEPGAAADGGA